MGRYLIVANQTLGGWELERKVKDRIEHGEGDFYVVVPMIEPEAEVASWAPTDPMFGIPVQTNVDTEAMDEARERSEHRLHAMIDKITSLGGAAEGEVGPTDPVRAAESALDREPFDEVIVSTLPAGISRWVKMDVASRIDRLADCPVTVVEAEQ